MMRAIAVMLLMFSALVPAAEYFVDFDRDADTNTGTDREIPGKEFTVNPAITQDKHDTT